MTAWRTAGFRRWRPMGAKLTFALLGLVLTATAGCAVFADLLNSDFLVGLGLDPATVVPQQGTVIVAFNNNTTYTASFSAYESVSATDLTQSSRNFSLEVAAGQTKNEVLDCPVGLISPGSLGATFTPNTQAAVVQVITASGAQQTVSLVDVEYAGDPLVSGIAYTCGDVIKIELSASSSGTSGSTATAQQFVLSVQVIPGQ